MVKLEAQNNCPLDGFKPCRQTACAWFTQVRGKNPQGGEDVDHWGCAVAWMPLLLIETAQQSRQTGAAVESFRNVMEEGNARHLDLLERAATARIGGKA
jgi:hypothetical protein